MDTAGQDEGVIPSVPLGSWERIACLRKCARNEVDEVNAVGLYQYPNYDLVGNIIMEFRYKYVTPESGILDCVGKSVTHFVRCPGLH